jgi:hypothetical protein
MKAAETFARPEALSNRALGGFQKMKRKRRQE